MRNITPIKKNSLVLHLITFIIKVYNEIAFTVKGVIFGDKISDSKYS